MTNTPTAHGVLEDPVAEIVEVSDFLKENAEAVILNENLAVAVAGLSRVLHENFESSPRISDAAMAASGAIPSLSTLNAAVTAASAVAQTVGSLLSSANPLDAARRARARRELGALDYIRAVRSAVEAGVGQREIARSLGIAQPSVSRLLTQAEARGVQAIPEGFSGASPYEVAERFAAGDIGRDALIRELSVWPYVENEGAAAAQAEWDSTPYPDTPGSFAEVGQAFDDGLIDAEAYDIILDASDDVPTAS